MYFYMLAAAAFLVGVICNSILRSGVNELTSNAENMETADNGFFRQMKLKYENTIKNGRELRQIYNNEWQGNQQYGSLCRKISAKVQISRF